MKQEDALTMILWDLQMNENFNAMFIDRNATLFIGYFLVKHIDY